MTASRLPEHRVVSCVLRPREATGLEAPATFENRYVDARLCEAASRQAPPKPLPTTIAS
jgi:hypothetical protein